MGFNPPVAEPVIEIHKEWLLPRWAYSDEEWDKFTYEDIVRGYFEYEVEVMFNGR